MLSTEDSLTSTTTTVRFYDSTFYTIALTSVTYLIFQTYTIRAHAHRLILFISFLCTCLGCEIFFHIVQPNRALDLNHLNITKYFSPTIIHLTLLLSISSFLWNATQSAALASILLPSTNSDKQQHPKYILRRWLRHVCVDHVFALLLVRLGRLTDVATITALSNMASICVITSWCAQIAVFPCMLCFLHALVVDTTISENGHPMFMNDGDEFNSILHRLKIIKILGLALFGLKISALSICETLALALTAGICLSCLVVAPPGREMSKYTRIFDIFIGKVPEEKKEEDTPEEQTKEKPMTVQKTIMPIQNIKTETIKTETIQKSKTEIIQKPKTETIEPKTPSTPVPGVISVLYDRQSTKLPTSTSFPNLVHIKSTSTPEYYAKLSDDELMPLIRSRKLPAHNLEKCLPHVRAVSLRRRLLGEQMLAVNLPASSLDLVPYEHYDYSLVTNQCCENVLGYIPIPIGYAGPLNIDNKMYYIPMATTEGALIASTNRGCKAATMSEKGIETVVFNDGMSRGPVLKFTSIRSAHIAYEWFETNFDEIKACFDKTSSYARLTRIKRNIVAHYLFVRFVATTGDAMGMNMLSKGVEAVLTLVKKNWPDTLDIISISGNYCIDKKPSALNWIDGRGKSVVAEAIISHEILEQVLKTNVERLVELNLSKNLLGSIMSASIGGFNAHAANIVAAMFIACGQDPAQVVSSSNCLTWLEATGPEKRDLYISCTMYSLEVGTLGGGTKLEAQQGCLKMLGVEGSSLNMPGENASQLARIICATVLTGELSLLSALATNELVSSHLRLNRSVASFNTLQ